MPSLMLLLLLQLELLLQMQLQHSHDVCGLSQQASPCIHCIQSMGPCSTGVL